MGRVSTCGRCEVLLEPLDQLWTTASGDQVGFLKPEPEYFSWERGRLCGFRGGVLLPAVGGPGCHGWSANLGCLQNAQSERREGGKIQSLGGDACDAERVLLCRRMCLQSK